MEDQIRTLTNILFVFYFRKKKKNYFTSKEPKKPCVRTQFVTTPNWYWVRTLKAQTIKFIKRGCSRTKLTLKEK